MIDKNEERQLVESELQVVASNELEEEASADLLLPEGDIQLNSMFGEAMYFTPPVYTFPIDGSATEEVTMQAPGKIWNLNSHQMSKEGIYAGLGIPKELSNDK